MVVHASTCDGVLAFPSDACANMQIANQCGWAQDILAMLVWQPVSLGVLGLGDWVCGMVPVDECVCR